MKSLRKHMASKHGRTTQYDQELRHYLYSLKAPINRKYFVCLQCNVSFNNNREYYLHKFMDHNRAEALQQQQQQVGGAVGDLEVVHQRHVNVWKVMQYMIEPMPGRTDWAVFVVSVADRFKQRVALFVRSENARSVTLQVNSYTWNT